MDFKDPKRPYSPVSFSRLFLNWRTFVMKMKECPSCAMEIEAKSKICPICQYEFAGSRIGLKLAAVILMLLFLYLIFF